MAAEGAVAAAAVPKLTEIRIGFSLNTKAESTAFSYVSIYGLAIDPSLD